MSGTNGKPKPKRTAGEIVLLAAARFEGEFTKWDLMVAMWELDPERFGMKGYPQHPDSNRCAMEFMGAKLSNPVHLGLVQHTGTSLFRTTALGKAQAEAVLDPRSNELHERLTPYVAHGAFRRWQENPEEPREFEAVRSFLRAAAGDEAAKFAGARELFADALDWCREKGVVYLAWHSPRTHTGHHGGPRPSKPPIIASDLADLADFLTALEYRFPELAPKRRAGKAVAS